MRTFLLLVVLLLQPLAGSPESRPVASPIGEEEGKILALEKAWNQAEQSKDARALDQILDPTLVYVLDSFTGLCDTASAFVALVSSLES